MVVKVATDDDDVADHDPNITKWTSVVETVVDFGKADVVSDASTATKHSECTGDYVANTVERAEPSCMGWHYYEKTPRASPLLLLPFEKSSFEVGGSPRPAEILLEKPRSPPPLHVTLGLVVLHHK